MEQTKDYIRLAADLQSDSIVDGPGLRTVIWTQGCAHHCPECQNPQTWDFEGGGLVPVSEVLKAIDELEEQTGITFSGGDPMYQPDDPMLHTLPAKLQVVYEISDKVQRGSYC